MEGYPMNKITTAQKLWHLPIAIALCTISGNASAFPGGNNSFFGGSNNGCGADWPAWTPMYWMEEMADMMGNDNKNNCYPNQQAYGAYPQATYNPYATMAAPQARQYQQPAVSQAPYQAAYTQRALLPYALAQGRTPRRLASPWSGMTSPSSALPFSSVLGGQQGGFSNLLGGRKSTGFMPFSRGFGSSNPFSSMSPMSSFGSPFGAGMNPMSMGGMGMNPMSMGMSPMGMGMNPMSMGGMGMNPMSMGMPGMSGMGMSPFGGSPFGGSSFMPKF